MATPILWVTSSKVSSGALPSCLASGAVGCAVTPRTAFLPVTTVTSLPCAYVQPSGGAISRPEARATRARVSARATHASSAVSHLGGGGGSATTVGAGGGGGGFAGGDGGTLRHPPMPIASAQKRLSGTRQPPFTSCPPACLFFPRSRPSSG